MTSKKTAYPQEFFDDVTLKRTYTFIETLKPNEITTYRKAYKREINQSNEENVVPEHTVTMRRCFLYLTHNYESIQ